jgi:hypothetical protein
MIFNRKNLVAIPPYCSGQFRGDISKYRKNPFLPSSRNPTVLLRAIPSKIVESQDKSKAYTVAIPPYCSGQFCRKPEKSWLWSLASSI